MNSTYILQLESYDHINFERQVLKMVEPQYGLTLWEKVVPNQECLLWTPT